MYYAYTISNLSFNFYFLGLACLPWYVFLEVVKCKDLLPCAYAWDSGGGIALACNLAIFFSKLVTCTHYGATYWDNLYS